MVKFASANTFLSHGTLALLKEHSEKRGLPISQLIAIAIDNELDQEKPFNFPCEIPTTEFIENAYTDQAARLDRFLMKFSGGLGREMLMIMRRDFGIDDRLDLMLAYRQLMMDERIAEGSIPFNVKFKRYPKGYKYTRCINLDPNAKKAVASKSDKIAYYEKQLKKLKENL